MSVKAKDLPELIAAAVKKAIAEQHLTDESLAKLLHSPITIGLIATPVVSEHLVAAPAERVPFPLRTIGILIDRLDELQHVANIKTVNTFVKE